MRNLVVCLAAAVLLVSGCATITGKEESPKPKQEGLNQVFYTFPDIPIPKELEFNREKSFIYETQALKAGVLVLSGNVDIASLDTYFRTNMAKSGWRLVNSFRYADVILNFGKEDRSSQVRISRNAFSTQVEIWVGPLQPEKPEEKAHDKPSYRGSSGK